MQKNLIVLLAILAICSAANYKCLNSEKKAKFCTEEYRPVCGISISNGQQVATTYGNRCSACSDKNVSFIASGACEDYSKESVFCHPDAGKQKFCTKEYIPVCGIFDQSIKCIKTPCGNTFGNKCSACSSGNVSHYFPGACDEIKV